MVAHPIHVAILDDDPSVRTALGRFLKAAGMTVDAHDTSDQFFKSVALKTPDCLLLDFQMPGMSGLEVLRYHGQRYGRVPTIIMTANDAPGLRSACLNAGANAYLNKPLNPEELLRTINEISEVSHSDMLASFASRRNSFDKLSRSAQPRCYSSPPKGKITRKMVT